MRDDYRRQSILREIAALDAPTHLVLQISRALPDDDDPVWADPGFPTVRAKCLERLAADMEHLAHSKENLLPAYRRDRDRFTVLVRETPVEIAHLRRAAATARSWVESWVEGPGGEIASADAKSGAPDHPTAPDTAPDPERG